MKGAASTHAKTMTEPQFRIFKTSKGLWCWRLFDLQRGTVLACGARAYKDRIDCIEAISQCEWSLRREWSYRRKAMYWDVQSNQAISPRDLALGWGAAVKKFQAWVD